MLRHCLAAAMVALLVLPVSAQKQSWPQWRGPDRNGHAPKTNLNTDWESKPPKLVWQSSANVGDGFASVSIADGVIYTTGNLSDAQYLFAVSEKTGKLIWKTPVTKGVPRHSYRGSRSTPTIDGDHLYFVPSDGQIICVAKKNGAIVWKKNFASEWKGRMMSGWGYSESPLIDGDHVLCTPGGSDAMVVCLSKKDGKQVWACAGPDFGGRKKGGAGYSSIVISNGGGLKQYVQLVGGGVMGMRASDGKLLWSYSKVANRTANCSTPVPIGDYVFASTAYGTGSCCLKLTADGKDNVKMEEVYFLSQRDFQNHHGGMINVGKHIYGGHGGNAGNPKCIELATGKIAWGGDFRPPDRGSASMVYVDGHLIWRFDRGTVALIEAKPDKYVLKGKFRPVFVKSPSWAHPVVCNGKLYLREKNTIMCYDISK